METVLPVLAWRPHYALARVRVSANGSAYVAAPISHV
jgi:hypothetical protein